MTKRVVMINNGKQTIIDPDFCPHLNVMQMITGSRRFDGYEVDDDEALISVCLDCGKILYDESYHPDEDKIPY